MGEARFIAERVESEVRVGLSTNRWRSFPTLSTIFLISRCSPLINRLNRSRQRFYVIYALCIDFSQGDEFIILDKRRTIVDAVWGIFAQENRAC